jgi:hypothetical protein
MTTSPHDRTTTRLHDCMTAWPHDHTTTRPHNRMTALQHDRMAAWPHDRTTARWHVLPPLWGLTKMRCFVTTSTAKLTSFKMLTSKLSQRNCLTTDYVMYPNLTKSNLTKSILTWPNLPTWVSPNTSDVHLTSGWNSQQGVKNLLSFFLDISEVDIAT